MQMSKVSNSNSITPLKTLAVNSKITSSKSNSLLLLQGLTNSNKANRKNFDFLRVSQKAAFQASNEALESLGIVSQEPKKDSLLSSCTVENLSPIRKYFDDEGRLVELLATDGSVHYCIRYENNITKITDQITKEVHTREQNEQGLLIREVLANGLEVQYTWDGDFLTSIILPDQSQIKYQVIEGKGTKIERFSKQGKLFFQQEFTLNEKGEAEVRLSDESPLIKTRFDEKSHSLITQSEALLLTEQLDEGYNMVSKTYQDTKTGQEKVELCPSGDLLVNRERKLDELHRVTLANGWKCSYDENGRLIEKRSSSEVISYQYDALDRLTQFKKESLEIEYTYDALGRCLSKTKHENGESKKELYLYHGMNEMAVYDEQHNPIHLRVFGATLHPYLCITTSIESNGKTYIPNYNSNFNMIQLIDAETKEVHHYESLDPFAENLSELNPICPWNYQGKHFDEDTGLIDFIHRKYDPSIQQWTSKDQNPEVDSEDHYTYCNNNPYKYIDPDGNFTVDLRMVFRCAKVGASIGGPVGGAIGAVVGVVAAPLLIKGIQKAANHIDNKDLAMAMTGVAGTLVGTVIEKVHEMPAFPDRELPRDPYGKPIPDSLNPHTQLGHREGEKEKYPQAREFGENGEPIRDIDFTDHCYPENHPIPHQHQHKENPTGGTKIRNKSAEPLPEWDYENN